MISHIKPQTTPTLIETLEKMLADAQCGHMVGMAYVFTNAGNISGYGWDGHVDEKTIGELTILQTRISCEIIDQRDEAVHDDN